MSCLLRMAVRRFRVAVGDLPTMAGRCRYWTPPDRRRQSAEPVRPMTSLNGSDSLDARTRAPDERHPVVALARGAGTVVVNRPNNYIGASSTGAGQRTGAVHAAGQGMIFRPLRAGR